MEWHKIIYNFFLKSNWCVNAYSVYSMIDGMGVQFFDHAKIIFFKYNRMPYLSFCIAN
jgi:hypothetical protein